MIDTEHLYKTVASGMKKYVDCPVIRTNQNKEPPAYPYIAYTITTPAGENKGTYGEYEDGKARKPVKQIWSLTAHSDNDLEALNTANKAREYLDYAGSIYFKDNGVVVEFVGNVGQRSNLLTAEYQHSYGFDCTFSVFDEIEMLNEVIEVVEFNGTFIEEKDYEEIAKEKEQELDIANAAIENYEQAVENLGSRLKGGESE